MSDIQTIKHIDIDESKLKLIPMLSMYPNLQSISIRNVQSLTGELIKQISEKCPQLTALSIENAEGLHGIDVSTFKNLQFLTIRSNQELTSIRGLAQLKNISEVEIYDNTSLIHTSKICSDLVRFIRNGTSLNLDVLMYPEMQKAILQHNDRVQRGIIQGEIVTQQMQNDALLWSEMINKQPDYMSRDERTEQKCTYRNSAFRQVDKKASEIIDMLIEDSDSDALKATILYDYLKDNVIYDNGEVQGDYTDRVQFRTGRESANGMVAAFNKGRCVCEGYVRAYMYLLKKCGIDSQEIGCLTCAGKLNKLIVQQVDSKKFPEEVAEKIKKQAREKRDDHSIIKLQLENGTFLCDITADAGIHRWNLSMPQQNSNEYGHFLLSKSEMERSIFLRDSWFDVSDTPFPKDELKRIQHISQERMESREKQNTDILRSAVQATETVTRTGEINTEYSNIRDAYQNVQQQTKVEEHDAISR